MGKSLPGSSAPHLTASPSTEHRGRKPGNYPPQATLHRQSWKRRGGNGGGGSSLTGDKLIQLPARGRISPYTFRVSLLYGLNRRRSRRLRLARPKSPQQPGERSPPGRPPPQPEPSRRPQPGCARRRRYLQHPPGRKLPGGPEPPAIRGCEATSAPGSRSPQHPRGKAPLGWGSCAPLPAAGPRSSGRCRRPPCAGPAPSRPSSRPARAAGQCGPRRGAGFNHLLRGASSKRCRLPCREAPALAPRRGGREPEESFRPPPRLRHPGALCPPHPQGPRLVRASPPPLTSGSLAPLTTALSPPPFSSHKTPQLPPRRLGSFPKAPPHGLGCPERCDTAPGSPPL